MENNQYYSRKIYRIYRSVVPLRVKIGIFQTVTFLKPWHRSWPQLCCATTLEGGTQPEGTTWWVLASWTIQNSFFKDQPLWPLWPADDLSETHVISCMFTTSSVNSAFVDTIPSWLLTKVLGLCCFVNRTIWSICDCQMVPCQVTRLPSCPAWCRNIYLSYRSFSNLPLDSWTVKAWGKCRHFRPTLETFVPPISGCHTSQVSLLSGRLRP